MEKVIAYYLRGPRQERQLDLCREYARLFLGVSEEPCPIFRDEDGISRQELPGFSELLSEAEKGIVGTVICADTGVIRRSVGELIQLVRRLDTLGTRLIIAGEKLDFSSPEGRVFLHAAETLLDMERISAAANIRDNMRALAKGGRWLGGITPTGYSSRRITGDKGEGKRFRLELVPEQAETVRLIFALFLELDSLSKVTKEIDKRKIRTKNGRSFSRFTIRQILENPVYMQADADAYAYFSKLGAEVCSPEEAFDGSHGLMVYNKTVQERGAPNQQREIPEWVVAVGEHQPIVSATSWITAQQQLARNKSAAVRRPKSEQGLIAELLYCGDCGAHMRPKLGRRSEGDDEPRFVYICETKEQSRSGECDIPNLNGQQADAAISAMLSSLDPKEPDVLPPRQQRPATSEDMAAHKRRLEEKKEQIAANNEGISKLVFTLIKAIDKNAYEEIIKQIDALNGMNAELSAQVAAMESLTAPTPLEDLYRDALQDILGQWNSRCKDLNMARRRAALRTLIDSVTWDSEELLVRLVGGAQFAVALFSNS